MKQADKHSRLQAEIDANLKRAYEKVLHEDVPDRFTQLLAQLKTSGANKDDTGNGADGN